MDSKLIDKLNKRKTEGTLRSLSFFDGMVDFCSNDYLGLSTSVTDNISNQHGSTGSRLISGNSKEAEQCESFLANYFDSEAALVFNSGYDANIGFFSAVPLRGDVILYDEKIHASVRDGIRLSFAQSFSFEHNSLEDLASKLERCNGTVYIAIESLYSMDGDLAPIEEIVELAEKFGAYLIIDEAHASGIVGKKGKGIVDDLALNSKVFARIITFGKAYGSHGAAILGSLDLKEFLINFARSFIYTTALSPNSYARIRQMVERSESEIERKKLHENILLFRSLMDENSISSNEISPIQMIRIGDIEKTKNVAINLQQNLFVVKAIYSPTVKKGEEGIRICIHSFNTKEEILNFCKTIKIQLNKVV
jgi:8-amino-7-oxononanoate synthase